MMESGFNVEFLLDARRFYNVPWDEANGIIVPILWASLGKRLVESTL